MSKMTPAVKAIQSVFRNVRLAVLDRIALPTLKGYKITKDYKNGYLVVSPKKDKNENRH